MEGDGDTLTQLAVVILLLGMSVPTVGAAYADAGSPVAYDDTATVDYDTNYDLDEPATSEGYPNIEIVVDGSTLVRGTDYEFNSSAGSVDWLNTTNSTDGDTATLDYEAVQRSSETEMAYTIIAPLMGLFGLFGLAVTVRVLWSYTAELWEMIGR